MNREEEIQYLYHDINDFDEDVQLDKIKAINDSDASIFFTHPSHMKLTVFLLIENPSVKLQEYILDLSVYYYAQMKVLDKSLYFKVISQVPEAINHYIDVIDEALVCKLIKFYKEKKQLNSDHILMLNYLIKDPKTSTRVLHELEPLVKAEPNIHRLQTHPNYGKIATMIIDEIEKA